MTYLDENGYPTADYINLIKDFDCEKMSIHEMVDIIWGNWYFGSWGAIKRKKINGKRKLELHTGGWGGNEEIVGAITSNFHLTHFELKYVMWKTGGHYYFEFKENKEEEK